MKKKFLTLIVAALFVLSGGLLAACGESKPAVSTKDFVECVNTMKADTALFSKSTVSSLETEFVLRELTGTKYSYYTDCLVAPLEYIDRYKDDIAKLDSMKLSGQSSAVKTNLEQNTAAMQQSYTLLSSQNSKMDIFEPGVAYDGMLNNYLSLCKDFIEDVYDVALCVAQLEDVAFNNISAKQTTNEPITAADTNRIKDYVFLYEAKDCADLLISNGGGADCSKTTLAGVSNAKAALTTTLTRLGRDSQKALSGEKGEDGLYHNTDVATMLNLHEKQNLERANLSTVLGGFSLKSLLVDYDGNTEKYLKVNPDASKQMEYLVIYYSTLYYYNTTLQKLL